MSTEVRRRIAAVVLAAAIVVAVLAISNEGPFEGSAPTEEDRVRVSVEALYGAAADGHFGAFCSRLTNRARRTLRTNAAQLTGEPEIPCGRALELTISDALEDTSIEVDEVSVSGPRARVVARFHAPDEEPELRTIYLEEIEGEWLVADPG